MTDDEAAVRSAQNLRDRVKDWKRLRCLDPECCAPATLGLGLHALNQMRDEKGLDPLRADQLDPSHPNQLDPSHPNYAERIRVGTDQE